MDVHRVSPAHVLDTERGWRGGLGLKLGGAETGESEIDNPIKSFSVLALISLGDRRPLLPREYGLPHRERFSTPFLETPK